MTANQISFSKLVEDTRNHKAVETETNRSNLADELLTQLRDAEKARSNRANEKEINRSNLAREFENNRSNLVGEAERYRSNRNAENLEKERINTELKKLVETKRNNLTREDLERFKNKEIKSDNSRKWFDTIVQSALGFLNYGKSVGNDIARAVALG